MGFYLRKSFRAGPIRLNLSKSGIGISGGVKGARLGVGPRGTYVHAGRGGFYYRKNLSSWKGRNQSVVEGNGCATLFLVITAIGLGYWFLNWLIDNPIALGLGIAITVSIASIRLYLLHQREKQIAAYKNALDAAFITSPLPPSVEKLTILKQQQQALPTDPNIKIKVGKIETDVYHAVLEKILDDGQITNDEAALIASAEQLLKIDQTMQLQTKKEIFTSSYFSAIEDHEITEDELSKLDNLMSGLAIPHTEVQHEIDIVQEIISTQSLCLPFKPIQTTVPIQKSETAFYQCSAQVLSRCKSKDSSSGYEHAVRRKGIMVLTNKRILIVGDGTTIIRFSDICQLDVDIDQGIIEIAKTGSGRPFILKLENPIYVGRSIDLLRGEQRGVDAV